MSTAAEREYQRQWRARNKERVRAYGAKWRANNRIAAASKGRVSNWKRHGIDPAAAQRALAAHNNGHCEICGCRKPGGAGGWHVDHDHKTKTIRGILCAACNRALGYFKDNAAILEAALRYLKGRNA